MPKAKYHFNTHSLTFEKVVVSLRKRFLRVLGFLSTSIVFGSVFVFAAYYYFPSPNEKRLRRQLEESTFQLELLKQRSDKVETVLKDIQERDNTIYRVIFEADPIPESVREAGYGGVDKYAELKTFYDAGSLVEASMKIDKLSKQLYIQSKSFDEVFELVKNKSVMLASIPAIQPVSNKDLKHLASGFGWRIHPVYKTELFHSGIDFTAPMGTEIYATGNGVVEKVELNGHGYGSNVIINHDFGYQTLYGHMSKIKVRQGQKISRGDIIGYVGNSGTSTGPHLHYEVIRNGDKVNPVNFFFNDLTPEEYERTLEIASQSNQSFD
ncbi:MAG: M23 family metallopeptidase [Bacteroidia bacterium]|nr:M23 family metallopeptidase [Bacteroidia bacterium]